jgi:CRP/FNR family transcriptional regulator, cyclic AMP receptor protein
MPGKGTACSEAAPRSLPQISPIRGNADVRALQASQFHVADGATTLRTDPTALLYVATVLAQRLDSANRALLDLKRQIQAGEPHSVVGRTVEKIEGLLGASGANLVYAGYPYDPFTTP